MVIKYLSIYSKIVECSRKKYKLDIVIVCIIRQIKSTFSLYLLYITDGDKVSKIKIDFYWQTSTKI